MSLDITKAIVVLTFVFSIGTNLSNISGVGFLVNKVLLSLILLLVIIGILRTKVKKSDVVIIVLVLTMYAYDVLVTTWPLYNSNELYYIGVWVLYLLYASKNSELIKRKIFGSIKTIEKIIIVWELVVAVSFLFPSSYDRNTFVSFAGGAHRFASSAVIILAGIVILYRYKNYNEKVLLLLIIPIIGVVLSGARTYLVIIGMVLAVIFYYKNIKKRYVFYIMIVPLAMLFLFVILNTSVMRDRISTMQNGMIVFNAGNEALFRLTSGRSAFWMIDLKKYLESPVINQILGNGFNFVRQVNETYYTTAIWAHNDFINIICCNGVLGLILYFMIYGRVIKANLTDGIEKKNKLFLLTAFHMICMFNAMFNMLYSYLAATFAIPFLAIALFDREYLRNNT